VEGFGAYERESEKGGDLERGPRWAKDPERGGDWEQLSELRCGSVVKCGLVCGREKLVDGEGGKMGKR
jgi:hypothetical protein